MLIFQKEIRDKTTKLSAIPLNTQKFKCLNMNVFNFLDSTAFLPDSLEKLTETLVRSHHSFPLLRQKVKNEEKRKLLLRKGVYPYSFATSISKLQQADTLPSKSEFKSDLSGEEISDCDYEHAKHVWKVFGCENMMDYSILYVKSDVLLLAEAVFDLRRKMKREFNLDLCQYLSLPMMAKDAMLKSTGAEIDLMSDPDMVNLVQSGIRGGLSYINQRKAEIEEYTRQGIQRSMLYADANNLYGKAMCFPMPISDYEWMTDEEIENFKIKDISEKEGPGYFFEVTLHYPDHLHLNHNSFPLAPEQRVITEEDLSPYASNCLRQLRGEPKDKTRKLKHCATKLVTSFRDREKYMLHGLNLKLYLEQGLELVKIHRGIKFYQSPFIRPYIQRCMTKRRNAKTKSEGDMHKLSSNALFGKMIEGVSKRMDCKFVYSSEQAIKRFSDPLYKGFVICGEDFSVTFHSKKSVKMNQCWAVGFSILELSKFVMQKMWYEEVKPSFGGRISTLMTDTDSWIMLTGEKGPDEMVAKLSHIMDFSNYSSDHPRYDQSRKNVVGFLKNELPHAPLVKFVGLRSKTYAIKTDDDRLETRAKGVKRATKKHLRYEDFARCLEEVCAKRVVQRSIQSVNHVNRLMESEKVAFSSFDDKRYLLCPIHSTPYGSILIKHQKRTGECYFCEHPDVLV